jgi:uncharacterized protein
MQGHSHFSGAAYLPHQDLTYAGSVFEMLSTFAAWYNALVTTRTSFLCLKT